VHSYYTVHSSGRCGTNIQCLVCFCEGLFWVLIPGFGIATPSCPIISVIIF